MKLEAKLDNAATSLTLKDGQIHCFSEFEHFAYFLSIHGSLDLNGLRFCRWHLASLCISNVGGTPGVIGGKHIELLRACRLAIRPVTPNGVGTGNGVLGGLGTALGKTSTFTLVVSI